MKTNAPCSRPMSPCLRLFAESVLAEYEAEVTIEKCLPDDAIVGSAVLASSAPQAADKNYN